ncbi:MAG: Ig-like domain-containing protein [Lachnospiraceae bacterium]|nr:Ig-like domain-containing protein [Lachnospiraceae bacterium]
MSITTLDVDSKSVSVVNGYYEGNLSEFIYTVFLCAYVQSDGKVILIQQNRHWEKGDGYTYGDKNGSVGSRSVAYFRYSNGATYTVTNTGVTSITETSARINAQVSPTATNSTVCGFELGTSSGALTITKSENTSGTTRDIWYDLGTGKWTEALKPGTTYYYRIYLVAGGTKYYSSVDSFVTKGTSDTTPPTIKNTRITELSPTGYTVACDVTDNVGVDKVCFPTWTAYNDQDDLNPDWGNKCKATSVVGSTYYYQVKISDHNNEKGTYITHIYAYDKAGNYSFSDINTVIPVYVSGIAVSPATKELVVGGTITMSASITPANATNKAVTWSSSNSGVATIDQKGVVTAIKAGTTTITAKAQDAGGVSATATITVKDPTVSVTGITLNKTKMTLEIGKTETLTATVTPTNATNKKINWNSSKESVATVDNAGLVTAKAVGTTTITVKTADGEYTADCVVTVTNPTGSAKVTVANTSCCAGSKVEIPVSISGNPGIAGAAFTVKYDKTALTLDELKAGTVFSSGTFSPKTDSALVQWYYAGEDSIKTNGVMFTAVFTVNSSAAKGNYEVTVGLLNDDKANFTDHNGVEVPVSFAAGNVTVSDKVKGDLTGDGSVAMGDVVKLARAVAGYITLTEEEIALADVTGDGAVAMGDVVKIARYVAGYIDSL